LNSRLCRRRVAVVSLAIVSTKYDVDMIVLEGSAKLRMESPHAYVARRQGQHVRVVTHLMLRLVSEPSGTVGRDCGGRPGIVRLGPDHCRPHAGIKVR
jgi:hypothetical protein